MQNRRLVLQVDILGLNNVSPWLDAMVSFIGLAGFLIPIGSPDASSASFLEGIVKASNSAEQINEGGLKRGHVTIGAYFRLTSRLKLSSPKTPLITCA
jgi:hypothetical protein